jgi:3',5'-cyclic AMP phosphodiesterase CpdA
MNLVQLTDLHVRPEGMAAYRVAETNMLTERAFHAVARLRVRPDAIVVSGDLTDNGLVSEYAVLAGILRRQVPDLPVYLIPGNHDRREVLKAEMSAWPGVAADPEFVQYAVDDLAVRLVMLDTVVPGHGHGILCERRLAWLDATLAQAPHKPTMIAMHHPPFVCGIAHMDAINLRNSAEFAAVVARHPQVERIVCGHHHRPVTARVAQAIASIAPSVAHQVELDLHGGEQGFFVMEPAAFQIHLWNAADGIVSHTAFVESFPGPFPFLLDPDYPGHGGS